MPRSRYAGVPALALLLSLAAVQAGAQEPLAPVQLGARLQPDTVTIGDRFTLILRVRAPAGSTIEFPTGPDSGAVELFGTAAFSAVRGDTVFVEQTAGYRLIAWDVGAQPIPFADVLVRTTAGERRVPVTGLSVFVRSVLPADTTLHVPKPARALFGLGVPAWVWWLLAVLALLLLLLLAWWLWRRRRQRQAELPPFEWARREFVRVEALRLADRDEGARHVALMTDVLRGYLWRRVPEVRSSQTSTELLTALRTAIDVRWDPVLGARAEPLFAQADLAKFAALPVPPAAARNLGDDARWLAAETERRLTTPPEAERAAA